MAQDEHNAAPLDPRVIPATLGSYDAKPGAQLTPQDWFVLSRIDGSTTAHTIAQMCGLSDEAVLDALTRLHQAALVRLPGLPAVEPAVDVHSAQTRSVPAVTGTELGEERAVSGDPGAKSVLASSLCDRGWPTPFGSFVFNPSDLEDGEGLTEEQKKVVIYFHHHLRQVTYYQLLNVPQAAEARAIRQAYFTLSKQFHPDRWFRKEIGGYREKIEAIFKWLNRANGVLTHANKRRGYDHLLSRGHIGEWELEDADREGRAASAAGSVSSPGFRDMVSAPPPSAQSAPSGPSAPSAPSAPSPAEATGEAAARAEAARRSAQMFRARARHAESNGDWDSAVDQLQRALELSPTTELRIALIECMLRGHSKIAEIERALTDALSSAGSDLRLVLLDAEVSFRKGDVERARALYEQVLVADAANPVARMGLERIRGTS